MPESELSFVSSQSFRNTLLAKNLAPYRVEGVFSPRNNQVAYETNLSVYSVVDSPGEFITNGQFSNDLYPLNEYGPEGGYNLSINFNNPPQQRESNKGEYDPNDTELDLVNEFFIDAAYIQNSYGPIGGFSNMVTITDLENVKLAANRANQPYWDPPSFEPSTYSPYSILISENPSGDNGSLSDDSYIVKLGAERLKFALQARIASEVKKSTVGTVNLDAFKDPFEASLMISGQEPLIYRDYRITIPEGPVSRTATLVTKLFGAYWPVSPIPGDYFDENTKGGAQTSQTSKALSVVNNLTGGLLGPILNLKRNPSEIFLANTGNGQRSVLFKNLSLNRFQPQYDKSYGGLLGVAQTALSLLGRAVGLNFGGQQGGYYVGSKTSEPSTITSPPNQIPVNEFGQQVSSPVYGPSELGKLYENNVEKVEFTFKSKPSINGGGISGGFVWTSPKTKGAQGYTVIPPSDNGGGNISVYEQKETSRSIVTKFNNSDEIELKEGSILYETQRLIESADGGNTNRLKHVGNAINQVSKVFHDGYKTITKGSQVIRYSDFNSGEQVGLEYCRVFTKDTPYYSYSDLQKSAGITTEGRRFSYSVIDNTYNLNIAPLRGDNSTNIVLGPKGKKQVKKYMFSLENLAWRTSSRPGYTVDDLPVCEQGPNGGRIMWFPPYDISFNDSSTASWNETPFLGRPEPIYTYQKTTRTGTLSWKIIVDSPSVLNTIVDKVLKGLPNEKVDSILESFFAGCTKYDIYDLAKKYNTFKSSELLELQTIITQPQLTPEEIEGVLNQIPAKNIVNPKNGEAKGDGSQKDVPVDNSVKELEKDFLDFAFYFENDIPRVGSDNENFKPLYDTYVLPQNITSYENSAKAIDFLDKSQSNTTDFFEKIIKDNFKKITEGPDSFVEKADKILSEGGNIKITLRGAASASASVTYNQSLSERRIGSVKTFFKESTKLKKYFENGSIEIVSAAGVGELETIPKGQLGAGGEIKCTEKPKNSQGQTLNGIALTTSVNAMACRRVMIKSVTVTKKPEPKTPEPKKEITITPQVPPEDPKPIIPPKSEPKIEITQKIREGVGKKILRNLLSECDYFDVLKEEDPTVFDSIGQKLKYFSPAFHSMTPEGLNARLTFLNQCVRPGETIPVIGPDGRPKYNDAVNTSFGAPPVLVLRIGDFYHTKIIPKGLQITYDPLLFDINPEGIGLQPMIAKVTLSFDFIGGHGLAKPVEQLQNALSFNYYANTEIYDERATATEDTSKLDKEIFDSIVSREQTSKPAEVEVKQENRGGKTIGDIATTIPVTGGETGFTTYQKVMDVALENSKQYYTGLLNFSEKISKQNNFGIWQLIESERNFTEGNFELAQPGLNVPPNKQKVLLFGKPINFESKINFLFEKAIDDVKSNNSNQLNFIIKGIYDENKFKESDIERLKINLIEYLTSTQTEFTVPIAQNIQEFSIVEQDIVQNIRKLNVVNNKTDGKILENGKPFVYTIGGTDEVSNKNQAIPNTLNELSIDYRDLSLRYDVYNNFMKSSNNKILGWNYSSKKELAGDFSTLNPELSNIVDKRFFMIMSGVFSDKNKLTDFKNKLLAQGLKDVNKFEKSLDKVCDKFKKLVDDELKNESTFFKSIRQNKDFINFEKIDTYTKGKVRKFVYTTVKDDTTQVTQEKLVSDVWSNVNVNTDVKTWDGKIKFN